MTGIDKVPWSCKEEWEYCRDNLFSSSVKMQQKALKHLFVWKIRNSNLPVAVECTLILMDAKLGVPQLKLTGIQTITAAESWYSMAITRFLNLVTDPTIGIKISNSIMDLAKQIGISSGIVNLRHAAAHSSSLPPLSDLKDATTICLEWLHTNYWLKSWYNDSLGSEETCNVVSSIFKSYHACTMLKQHLLRGCRLMADISDDSRKLTCSIMPEKIQKEIEESLDSWLIEDAYRIVFKIFSRRLMNDTKNIEEFLDYFVNSDQSFISRDMLKQNKIRKSAFKQWADILSVICDSAACVYLLKRLLKIIVCEVEESWRRECAAAFVNEILESIRLCRTNESCENFNFKRNKLKRNYQNIEKYQTKHGIVISNITLHDDEVMELVRIISDNPNRYSQIILKNLFRMGEKYLQSSTLEKLSLLISIYKGESGAETSLSSKAEIHTVRELLGDDYEAPSTEFSLATSETYFVGGESSWSKVPLGSLPWQTEFHSWLRIYDTDGETNDT